jgi:hypothetical protein
MTFAQIAKVLLKDEFGGKAGNDPDLKPEFSPERE